MWRNSVAARLSLGQNTANIPECMDTDDDGFSAPYEALLKQQADVVSQENSKRARDRNYKYLTQINWAEFHRKLPHDRSHESYLQRMELWKIMDDGNGYASFLELETGMRNLLGINVTSLLDITSPVQKAYNVARNYSGSQEGRASDFVQKCEFRVFLEYVQKYFELFVMFLEIDENFDKKVTPVEFKAAVDKLSDWGLHIHEHDSASVFRQVDADNNGSVSFDEFAAWAIIMGLDFCGDDSESSSAEEDEFGNWRKTASRGRRAGMSKPLRRSNSNRRRSHRALKKMSTPQDKANFASSEMLALLAELRPQVEVDSAQQDQENGIFIDERPSKESEPISPIGDGVGSASPKFSERFSSGNDEEDEAEIELIDEAGLPEFYEEALKTAMQHLSSPYGADDCRVPLLAFHILEIICNMLIPVAEYSKTMRVACRAMLQHFDNEEVQLHGGRFLEKMFKCRRKVAAISVPACEILPVVLASTNIEGKDTRNEYIWEASFGVIYRVLVASLNEEHGSVDRDVARHLGVVEKAWLGLMIISNEERRTEDVDSWCAISNCIEVLLDLVVAPHLAASQRPKYRTVLLAIEKRFTGNLEGRAHELRQRLFPEDDCGASEGELDFRRRWEAEDQDEKYPRCMERYLRFVINKCGIDWKQTFRRFDYNGSGTMSNSEHEDALKKCNYPFPQDADEIFYFIDEVCDAHGHLGVGHFSGVLAEAMSDLKVQPRAEDKSKKKGKKNVRNSK